VQLENKRKVAGDRLSVESVQERPKRNTSAFRKHQLLPRYLVDVSVRDQSTTIFGHTFSMPFGIAPTGAAGLFRRGADLMLAEAARDANIPYIMSGSSNDTIEAAARYLDEIMADAGLPTAPSRKMAYLANAPKMVDALIEEGMAWRVDPQPDYLDSPHASAGRDLDAELFDTRKLGRWRETMRRAIDKACVSFSA